MISIKEKRILLIGGAGFIGHNMALALAKCGANVSIIDSLQVNNILAFQSTNNTIKNREFYIDILNQRLELLKNAGIPVYVQDARDYHQLSKSIDDIDPQIIVMLSAVSHADRSNKDPHATFDHSLNTLENALDIAKSRVEHFIYFSSSMAYGNFPEGFVTEESICNPMGIYGSLKFAGEKMVIAYNQVFNMPYTIIRPSALYGERCVSLRVGQLFIENAMNGLEINIKGDGSDSFDFTYIDDLVSGVINVMENENSKGQVFNITYGSGRSLQEMVTILKDYFPDMKVNYLPKDKLMPKRGTLSVEKAKKLIGYEPKNPLEIGFVKYIEWYKSFMPKKENA